MKTTISNLKDKFSKGKCPTEEDFADVFDSFVHKNDLPETGNDMSSISDIDISEIDSLGNAAVSETYIVSDGTKRGILIFENTGNNAQRQTLYMENVLKYRTRDADGWGEWTVLADFGNGLAAVATTGSYNDLKNRPSLATVATSGNYNDLKGRPSLAAVATSGSYNDLRGRPSLSAVATSGSYGSLSNRPLQGKITLASADGLYYSSQNGVYVVEDGGTTQGLLFFSTVGNGGLQQYLLQDGAIKSRTGTYTAGIPEWNGWQAQEAVPGTQKTLYIDSATPVNGQGDVEIDFAAEFDTIYFGASKPWAIKSVPDVGSGKEVIRKNVITASGIITPPRYSGSSSSATVAINGETYGFTSDVVVITSISAYAGPYVSLTAAKESHTILGRRIEQSNLTCYELWLEVDHDAKTVTMTLIPKY